VGEETKNVSAIIDQFEPYDILQRGFRPGGQTLEVAETVRTLAKKCHEWGRELWVLKSDVQRAFDNISHGCLCDAMQRRGVPAKLRHAVMQELACRMTFSCMGTTWQGVSPSKGGRQGGSETPLLWNILLGDAIEGARTRWKAESLGWSFDGDDVFAPHMREIIDACPRVAQDPHDPLWVPYLAWADDLVLCGNTQGDTRRMWQILTEELRRLKLTWKTGSLELYRPGVEDGLPLENLRWESAGEGFEIKQVRRICILGVLISETGSDLDACRFRISQGWQHFECRKGVLCSKLIPLHMRWRRIQETVCRTVLYGAGGWAVTEAIAHELVTFERKILGRTLNLWRRDLELPQEFHVRLNSKVSFFMKELAWTSLRVHVESMSFGWVGHVVRMGICPASLSLLWRPAAEVREVSTLRRAKPGRPPRDPLERLTATYGPLWETIALDRADWKRAKSLHLQCLPEFRTVGECGGDWRLLRHISNRAQEMLGGRHMLLGAPLMFAGDSALVVNYVNGKWQCGSDSVFLAQIRRARWLLYAVEHGWKYEPFTSDEPLLVQRPRAYNAFADACCSFVLDTEGFVQHFWDLPFDPLACPVHVSFDGASRGNPGPAACGAVVQVHHNDAWHLAAAFGCCIGHATNNVAEFEGLIASVQLLVAWSSRSGIVV
jgi:hypothetical protein